jgi:hypothetical protein
MASSQPRSSSKADQVSPIRAADPSGRGLLPCHHTRTIASLAVVSHPAELGKASGCRAERASPVQDNGALLVVILVAFIVGYFATEAFINTRAVADEFDPVSEEFGLWTAVLGVVGGLALASVMYCVAAVVGVGRLFAGLSWQTVGAALLGAVAPLAAIFAALIVGSTGVPESIDKRLAEATRPFILGAGACAVPGLMGMLLLRALARQDSEWSETSRCRVALVLRLRTDLRRLLAILGAFLTTLVIATGLRREAVLALAPQTHLPAVSVVLYGFVFAALLGLFYAAASSAVDARASALIETNVALPAPDAKDLVEIIQRRRALESLVGLGDSPWRTFESVVVVAAPLLSALVGTAVGNG